MKDLLVIFGMIVAALAAGALLFFFGPSSFRGFFGGTSPSVSIQLLKEGNDATAMTDRVNYRITDASQLSELWGEVGATPGTTPNVDFTKEDVLAVFDGTHSSTGYRIAVTSVVDANGMRTVHVTRFAPGTNCVTGTAITAPYQIVVVPKSSLTLTHADQSVTQNCS